MSEHHVQQHHHLAPADPAQPADRDHNRGPRADSGQARLVASSDFAVIWQNLSYKVDIGTTWFTRARPSEDQALNQASNNNKRVILDRICGDIKSRQLTAIMGPSGAGKSTLLCCLFQNRRRGVSGRIMVDSKNKSKLKVCFIPQNDYLNEWLTVREDLIFVSKLKSAKGHPMLVGASPQDNSVANASFVVSDQNQPSTKSRSTSCTLIDHEANALRVAELLGLQNCLDVTIKNISGGQKKRLSVARELMSQPDILVLDEPTTGLDSATCYKTVKVLAELAHNPSNHLAVVVTIHQPEKSVFNLFDKTYFLSKAGGVIYDGPPKMAVQTMQEVAGFQLPSAKYNPAAFLIDIASSRDARQDSQMVQLNVHQRSTFYAEYTSFKIMQLVRSKSTNSVANWNFCSGLKDRSSSPLKIPRSNSTLGTFSFADSSEAVVVSVPSGESSPTSHEQNESQSAELDYYISMQLSHCLASHKTDLLQSFHHVFILTHRSWLSLTRNPTFTRSRLVFHIVLPFIMLAVLGNNFGSPNNCPKLDGKLNIQEMKRNIDNGLVAKNVEETRVSLENLSFFFILLYGFAINIISSTASYYPLTMHMFKKERINGLYSTAPYFIGQMLSELPFEIFFPTLSILIFYPMSGQISSFMEWRMLVVCYFVFLVSYAIHSMGLMSGSIFVNNVSIAVMFGQTFMLPHIMFSGYIIRFGRMSDWMQKLSHLSIFRQGLKGIALARFGFDICECDEEAMEDGLGFEGMPAHVRHVLEYMFPDNETIVDTTGNNTQAIPVTLIFDKMADRFTKAQSMGMDINSCADVRPYVLELMDMQDSDIFYSVLSLILITSFFKLMAFYFMKSFPYRNS